MRNEPSTPRELRYPCVAERAARQWGNVTTEQLRRCGVTPQTVQRWVAEGRLHQRHRGVYAVGHRHPAPEAAIANHGLGRPPSVVTVAVPARRARKQRGIEPHSSLPFERNEVVIRQGLRTTSIERTLLDLAAIGEPVERLVAEVVAKRLTSIAKLRAYVERRSGARGSRRLRACIEGRQTRSELEKEFARWLEQRGIERPAFNEPSHGTRHSFEADRRRDAYTAARDLRTIRVTPRRWRQDGDRLDRDIRRALACR
jgi:hypothetical protein